MKRKIWPILAKVILVAVAVFAASLFFTHLFAPAALFNLRGPGTLNVSDVKARAGALQGVQISVRGQVASGSVNLNQQTQTVTFTLTDGREDLGVTYTGKLPNNFKPGAILIVQGKYDVNGILEADGFGRASTICIICHG